MYNIEELAKYISLSIIPTSWINCYEDIKKQYKLNWLDKYDFNEILSYYEFSNDFKNRVEKELKLLKQDKKLNVICYIMYYILFIADANNYYDIWSWKSTENIFKNNGSYMIPVISLLCGYQIHIENMNKRKFDEYQIAIQKYNIRLTCTNDFIENKIDGIRFSQMIWGSFFMKGNLIQIGRLQYEVAVKNFNKLDKYFGKNYQYIYIHIPKDNDLNENEVLESLNSASKFIKKYYLELKKVNLAYYTQTWLLSPEIKEILSKDSNIIKYQEKFNIIEYEENISDFLNFVFNDVLNNKDYKDLPDKTTLQKELKRKLLNGERLHLGLGFLKK